MVGLAAGAVLLLAYARGQGDDVVLAGNALGTVTGRTTSLLPGVGGAGIVGGPLAPGDVEAAVGAADGAVISPGPDSVVGNSDDVVFPGGMTRTTTAPGGGPTTATTRLSASTSTTLPPIPTDLAIGPVDVPATAGDSTDGCGKAVEFKGAQLVDHQPGTAWRMEGDGTGKALTVPLGGSHRVVSVGLIPGYALVDACDGTNRFQQNRRVTKVTWQFDDGASVVQDLRDEPEMQSIAVSAQASSVTLRIDGVSADPERDFTAISELNVRGA